MLSKILIVKLASNLITFTPQRLLSSYCPNVRKIIKGKPATNQQFWNKKISFQFSNISDVNNLKQAYNKHGWSNEYIKTFTDAVSKYQKGKDYNLLIQITQFHLQKLRQYKGIDNHQYASILYNTIYFYAVTGKIQKFYDSLNILYHILSKNRQIGKININGQITHLEYKASSMLLLMNHPQQTIKWLNLFLNKYSNFDETSQIEPNQRFHTYFYLSTTNALMNKNNQQFENIKKAFNLLEQGKVHNLPKQSQIKCIFSYGRGHLKYGDKQIANKAFNIVDGCFDWSKPNQFLLHSLKICQQYDSDLKLPDRGLALLQKFQKVFEQKKDNKQYSNLYNNAIFIRIRTYLVYKKYQKIYQVLNNDFQQFQKLFPAYVFIYYDVLRALCQYKLAKIQHGQNSLEKALKRAQSINTPILRRNCDDICIDIEFLQKQLDKQIKIKQKEMIKQIKGLVMKAAANHQ